jgi:hypothetical protein
MCRGFCLLPMQMRVTQQFGAGGLLQHSILQQLAPDVYVP